MLHSNPDLRFLDLWSILLEFKVNWILCYQTAMEREETKVWLLVTLGLSLERGAASVVGQVAPLPLDYDQSSLVWFQGILMLQDQYRAIMHFSIPKETQIERNALKSSQDWICIKVCKCRVLQSVCLAAQMKVIEMGQRLWYVWERIEMHAGFGGNTWRKETPWKT